MAGKKYAEALQKVDRNKQYTVEEAVGLVKELAKHKFDESVDVAIRLGVDPRKADQMVRGTVSLPHGTGKTVRVAVFAAGPAAEEAREAGADIIGAKDLADRIEKENFLDFDAAVGPEVKHEELPRLIARGAGAMVRRLCRGRRGPCQCHREECDRQSKSADD